MFKTVQRKILSFDIEWVPDPEAAHFLYGCATSTIQEQHAAMQRLWAEGGATEEEPQPYLKTIVCRIVSLAGIFRHLREDGTVELKLLSLPLDCRDPVKCSESSLLRTFANLMAKHRPQLVGYNSSQADLPILVQRGLVQGVPMPALAQRPDKPWEGTDYFSPSSDDHIDLAVLIGRFRNLPRLHEAATLSRIPGKLGLTGYSVPELWLQGKVAEILAYNEWDAATTHLLWARLAHFAGHFDEETWHKEQSLLRSLLEEKLSQGESHWEEYLTEWDRLQSI